MVNKFLKFFVASDDPEETEATPSPKDAGPYIKPKTVDVSDVNQELFDDLMSSSVNGAYTQFFDMVKSLGDDIKEEAACFKAAFKVICKMSPTSPEKLMLKVDDCMNALKEKKVEFMQGVEEKNAEIKQMSDEVEAKTKEINGLKSQIDSISQDIAATMRKVEAGNKKVESAVAGFNVTYKAVEATLEQNKRKIGNYAKGV